MSMLSIEVSQKKLIHHSTRFLRLSRVTVKKVERNTIGTRQKNLPRLNIDESITRLTKVSMLKAAPRRVKSSQIVEISSFDWMSSFIHEKKVPIAIRIRPSISIPHMHRPIYTGQMIAVLSQSISFSSLNEKFRIVKRNRILQIVMIYLASTSQVKYRHSSLFETLYTKWPSTEIPTGAIRRRALKDLLFLWTKTRILKTRLHI